MSCRYFGISRQAYYTWYRRYQAEGVEGLRTRSKAPKHSPNATHVEVVGKIIYLRQNYHFGPEKIAMYLKRYHDVTISKSGVWRILNRLDMGRLPASQRYKRHDRRGSATKTTARPPGPDRRQVHRAPRRDAPGPPRRPQQVLPVHRDRRLHPTAGPADLPAR